jgi:hypothetical protein
MLRMVAVIFSTLKPPRKNKPSNAATSLVAVIKRLYCPIPLLQKFNSRLPG